MSRATSITPTLAGDWSSSSYDSSSSASPNVSSSATSNDASSEPSPDTEDEPTTTRTYLPLSERIPKTSTVVNVVRSNLEVGIMLEYSKNFTEEADQATLFQEELWGKAPISYVNAVLECAASTEKELEKMQKKFRKMKEEILDFVATYDLYVGDESISEEKKLESKRMLHLLGFHFLTEYPKLVKSSWGANILSIHEQIEAEVNIAVELEVGQLFGDDERLAEHAYYVVGFLCHAGIRREGSADEGE